MTGFMQSQGPNAAYVALNSSPAVTTVLRVGGANSAEIYNSSTGLWTNTGVLNQPRQSFGLVKLANGNSFVAGGSPANSPQVILTSTEEYQVASGTWEVRPVMGTSRASFSLTLLANGKVLGSGGSTLAGSSSTSELYTP